MQAEIIFRTVAIIAGVLLLILSFLSLVRKKMTEGIALGWGYWSSASCCNRYSAMLK